MRFRLRTVIAACVFLSVVLALGIIVSGPGRFFSGGNVQTDMACHISHCNRGSDDMKWRQTGLNNPDPTNR